MSRPIDRVLDRLPSVRAVGAGWQARCPAHDDRTASLSIGEGDDGRVLLHCHAGCSAAAVAAGLGLRLADLFADRPPPAPRHVSATAYVYRQGTGEPLYRVVRTRPKGFYQQRWTGRRWMRGMGDTPRVLYRLPELLASGEATVYVVEGEKDADRLAGLGLVATTNVGGAGKWRIDYGPYLRGRKVVILPDNDAPGLSHARHVASALTGLAAEVRLLLLPGLAAKGDVSDWLDAGGTAAELVRLADGAALFTARHPLPPRGAQGGEGLSPDAADAADGTVMDDFSAVDADDANDADDDGGGRETPLGRLLALAEGLDLFHTPDGRPYGQVTVEGRRETWEVSGKRLSAWLAHCYYQAVGQGVSQHTIANALMTLTGRALYEGAERPVYLRVAGHGGGLYLDLGNEGWQVVEVTPQGWRVVDEAPVLFRRTPHLQALPTPSHADAPAGGGLAALRRLLNLPDEDGWILIVAWLLSALFPQPPYPILILQGEQGSAKSTTARLLRRVVDPWQGDLRSPPADARDLAIAARNTHVLAFDNLSGLPVWLADALCRLATGSAYVTRTLYTDDDETVLSEPRPVILNGIDYLAGRSDLADRALVVTLPPIPPDQRRTEAEVEAAFTALWPSALAELLDAAVLALARLPDVRPPALPRLADFARRVVAAEPRLPWAAGRFLAALEAHRGHEMSQALESDILARAVLRLLGTTPLWQGTASDLADAVRPHLPDPTRPPDWLRHPGHVSNRLNRAAPLLRYTGVSIEQGRVGRVGARTIVLKSSMTVPSAASAASGDAPR